jgi:site-specific DNA-methyltransferase (adenine-specific)
MSYQLLCGDCLEELKKLPDNSIDSCVTDPPYHLTSIVKRFGKTRLEDNTRTSARVRDRTDGYARLVATGFMGKTWDGGDIAFQADLWREVWRVLKPGAHLAAMGATRGYHRMACAIEDAGFEVRDSLMWIYGTGFPKSHKVGEGWGTALKPAFEPIVLARKPLSEKTVAANVLKWGTGAINIDGCRVATFETSSRAGGRRPATHEGYQRPNKTMYQDKTDWALPKEGRWPANVITDGSEEVVKAFPSSASGSMNRQTISKGRRPGGFGNVGSDRVDPVPNGPMYADSGSAARFFYSAKASKEDRADSKHPTVKPIALMQYLVRLITPPNGTVLDPFAGTGTTGAAAAREGMRSILIEREKEYQDDIKRRMGEV